MASIHLSPRAEGNLRGDFELILAGPAFFFPGALPISPCSARVFDQQFQLGSKTSDISLKMHQAILGLDPLWKAQTGGYVGFIPPKICVARDQICTTQALKSSTCCKLTFDERVVVHRVAVLRHE